MRRAATNGRIRSFLALVTIGAASVLSLHAHPWLHPASHALISAASAPADTLQPADPSFKAAPGAALPRLLSQTPAHGSPARLLRSYGKLPLAFIANRGQLDRRVAYYIPGRDKSLYFTAGGVTFALAGKSDHRPRTTDHRRAVLTPASFTVGSESAVPNPQSAIRNPKSEERWALKLEFVGARPDALPEGRETAPTVVSYFQGPQTQWHTGIQTCASLAYNEVWPGIDLVYAGTYERLKYTFEVKPGADPEQIRLAYHGASDLALTPEGGLAISTPAGGFTDDRPIAYQEIGGRRVPVAASYVLDEPAGSTLNAQRSSLSSRGYHFRLGAYDHSRPLEIDPVVVVYGGFFGGDGDDIATGIAVDSAGNTYMTGSTRSQTSTFPVKAGPSTTASGGDDAFVVKLNAAGTSFIYAGFIGGSGDDDPNAIAVDKDGNAYITGFTESSETSFPVKVGPGLKYKGGFYDAFVAKVNPTGTGLVYAGYIGGSGDDRGQGIAVDSAGNAYVTGFTSSTESSFPVKGGPKLSYGGGPYDAFVARVNAAGTALDYAGYLGGAGDDEAFGIAVDSAGNAYVTGSTTSSESSFPVKGGPSLTYSGAGGLGYGDAFVAEVKPDGSSLVYAGYLGGSGDDRGYGIAVDSAGNAYVAGITSSTTFPVKVGPQRTYPGGSRDGFVAKVSANGTGLVYSGYVGGNARSGDASGDDIFGIAVNSAGNAYVVGRTASTDLSEGGTLPSFRGPNTVFLGSGASDVLVGEVKADGSGYVYLGYIGAELVNPPGGSHPYMSGLTIAVDGAGNTYVAGRSTGGGRFPGVFPTPPSGSDLANRHGALDVVLAKIAARDLVALSLPASAAPGSKVTATVTLDVPAPLGGELIQITSGNRAVATPDMDSVTIPAGKQTATFTVTAAASPTSQSGTITVYDDTFAVTQTLTIK